MDEFHVAVFGLTREKRPDLDRFNWSTLAFFREWNFTWKKEELSKVRVSITPASSCLLGSLDFEVYNSRKLTAVGGLVLLRRVFEVRGYAAYSKRNIDSACERMRAREQEREAIAHEPSAMSTMLEQRLGGQAGCMKGFTHTWKCVDFLDIEEELLQVRKMKIYGGIRAHDRMIFQSGSNRCIDMVFRHEDGEYVHSHGLESVHEKKQLKASM